MQRHNTHIASIAIVAHCLSQLDVEIVFTGGAIVGLLQTDRAAPDVRPTDDVDVIVSITSYSEYAALQETLRQLGLKHDINGPNCRFTLDELKIDIMPSSGKILGFTNRWYELAVLTAKTQLLPDGTSIRLISAPTFIATKLEAFYDRGKGDFTSSHDLEDIIAVIDGRPELLEELNTTSIELRRYLADQFGELTSNREFIDALSMYLMPDEGSQARAKLILNRMRALSSL